MHDHSHLSECAAPSTASPHQKLREPGITVAATSNDVRPITSTDGRIVNYYASGGVDVGGSPVTIVASPYTPLRQLVIEFPSTLLE
jgi:hypothetical protein